MQGCDATHAIENGTQMQRLERHCMNWSVAHQRTNYIVSETLPGSARLVIVPIDLICRIRSEDQERSAGSENFFRLCFRRLTDLNSENTRFFPQVKPDLLCVGSVLYRTGQTHIRCNADGATGGALAAPIGHR